MSKWPLIYDMRHYLRIISMMYRALWGQRHEGDTGISQYDPCTVHHPKYQNHINHVIIGFKHDMTYMVLILNEAEICKQSSEAGDGDSCIVGNLCIILWVTCIATPLWRHIYSDVTKSTQKMDANMRGWEILWKASFFNHPSTNVNEINFISNTNPPRFCKK